MAWVVDGWIWEPVDLQILRCAKDGTLFPSSRNYLWQAESLEKEGFLKIGKIEGNRMAATLTAKGRKTARKIFS